MLSGRRDGEGRAPPRPGSHAAVLVFDRDQLRHLVALWGADHILAGTDYPYDMGMYDPRGFVGGCRFLTEADKARILGLNAARLLKIGGRLSSMGIGADRNHRKAKKSRR